MHGVSKLSAQSDVMIVGYSGVDASFMVDTLAALAAQGVVVDMISQTAPVGSKIHFSFTAPFEFFEVVLKILGGAGSASPMISSGYSKIYLFGEEMVESVGVAARALAALAQTGIEIAMITTSDLDISILVHGEEEDSALHALHGAFSL